MLFLTETQTHVSTELVIAGFIVSAIVIFFYVLSERKARKQLRPFEQFRDKLLDHVKEDYANVSEKKIEAYYSQMLMMIPKELSETKRNELLETFYKEVVRTIFNLILDALEKPVSNRCRLDETIVRTKSLPPALRDAKILGTRIESNIMINLVLDEYYVEFLMKFKNEVICTNTFTKFREMLNEQVNILNGSGWPIERYRLAFEEVLEKTKNYTHNGNTTIESRVLVSTGESA